MKLETNPDYINKKAFGRRVAFCRTRLGLTINKARKQIGVASTTLSHIENGDQAMRIKNLVAICNVYDVSPDILLQDADKFSQVFAIEEYCRMLDLSSASESTKVLSALLDKEGK